MAKVIKTLILKSGKPFKIYDVDTPETIANDLKIKGENPDDYKSEITEFAEIIADAKFKPVNLYQNEVDLLNKELVTKTPGTQEYGRIQSQLKSFLPIKEDPYEGTLQTKDPNARKIIEQLLSGKEASRVLSNVETFEPEVKTGPYWTKFFDASIPKYDEKGIEIPPDLIDSFISSVLKEPTQKTRKLDQILSGMMEYAMDKGGKQFTGVEKAGIFRKIPSIYENEDSFKQSLTQAQKDLYEYTMNKIDSLAKGYGMDREMLKEVMRDVIEKYKPNNTPEETLDIDQEKLDSALMKKGIK